MRLSAFCGQAHFVVLEKNFQIFSLNVWHIPRAICWGVTKGEIKRRQLQEVSFSDLTPQEENQLYTYDTYFEHDEAEKSFCVAGKEITAKLLAEALHSLPDDKREAVLLYYFFEMNDAEIAKLRDVPRSTIQYRRTSSFELLKRYLEERAYDCT